MLSEKEEPVLPRPTIEKFSETFRNEEPHSSFVASLAVRIFDAVRELFNLPKGDRLLLETAARIHDIGYGVRPADHIRAGVEVVKKYGLKGFSRQQIDRICAIISLHGPLDDPLIGQVMPPGTRGTERLFKLGAILRVADGLDHGHLQEIRLVAIRHEEGLIRLHVEAPPDSTAIERAMAKSELWQKVFPIGLAIEHEKIEPTHEPSPDTPAGEALRRLLLAQFRVLRMTVRRAARDEEDDEALHDLRIAVRSLRRLLEAFEKPLRHTSAPEVQERLRAFAKRLGPARDFDVWYSILQRPRYRDTLQGADEFLQSQARERARLRTELRQMLNSPETQETLHRLGYLMRIELPFAQDRKLREPFGRLIVRRIKRAWKSVMKKQQWARQSNPDRLHALRVRIRKLRLLAWLTRAALPEDARYLIESAHELERNLGRLHDLDEALRRAGEGGAPSLFMAKLAKRRRKELRNFRKRWSEWVKAESRRRCRAVWSADRK